MRAGDVKALVACLRRGDDVNEVSQMVNGEGRDVLGVTPLYLVRGPWMALYFALKPAARAKHR